jgi:hypothetical protein
MDIYRTRKDVKISVYEGQKKDRSAYDFIVKYTEPLKRERTPKHIHLIVDLYLKWAGNRDLTLRLRDHMLSVFQRIRPITSLPPRFQVFTSEDVEQFQGLNGFGEYDVEFVLAVSELLMIQEKTNYPFGSMTQAMYSAFGKEDIFGVISAASFRGQVR